MSIWRDFTDRHELRTFLIGYKHILVRLCVSETSPCASYIPIFSLNVQTDYYNGHPRHFADELPDYLEWIQVAIGKSSRTGFVYLCLV